MKIKKIKENFEDMQLLLEDAYNSGFISEKKFNRYTETFMEAAAKLDNMKQLKEENQQLKKSSEVRENTEETRNIRSLILQKHLLGSLLKTRKRI